MKKLFVGVLMVLMLFGCAGMNASVPVNIATDIAFVTVLQNNPSYKVPVVSALQATKVFLNGKVTYDDLILFINKQFGGKYAYVGVILMSYLDTDKPVFETYLPLLEEYKAGIIKKLDRFIMLAGMVP